MKWKDQLGKASSKQNFESLLEEPHCELILEEVC